MVEKEMVETTSTICENLVRAFDEQKDDPLSLVTIIDVYAEKVNTDTRSIKDKVEYLQTLLSLLQRNPDILYEISWDLPKALLDFFTLRNMQEQLPLNKNQIVMNVMKCFSEIATTGNPKECLMTGCELLSDLSLEEQEIQTEQVSPAPNKQEGKEDIDVNELITPETILSLKLYAFIELLGGVLNRIETLYPSKFLVMVSTSLMKFIRESTEKLNNPSFLLRRVYSFCHNYQFYSIDKTSEGAQDLSTEALKKLSKDETDLQKKIIGGLFTFALGNCLKNNAVEYEIRYFKSLSNKEEGLNLHVVEFSEKYLELVKQYNIDFKPEFSKILEESRRIYRALPKSIEENDKTQQSALNQVIYQLSYTYELKKAAEEISIELNSDGMLILSAMFYSEEGISLLNIEDAIYLYLRYSTMSLYAELLHNKGAEAIIRFWLWVTITQEPITSIKDRLKNIPSYILTGFLQMLLLKTCTERDSIVITSSFTLLTRLLCLTPEKIAFDFILDTLLSCPYVHAKSAVLEILKDLTTKTNQILDDNDDSDESGLNEKLSELVLKDDKSNKAPSLPPRPYILINEDRMASIHSIALFTIRNVLATSKASKIDLLLILNYMSFFVSLRYRWNNVLLQVIHDEIENKFNTRIYEDNPEIGFIKIANDTLGEYLETASA
ncbi:Ybp2p NDAI_0I01690 [Naumovozyma dairenensis CBS 421]|uniref:Uncharacterized protein n=1 Tax=Naumovozyma dairenensis (strain ATCC 10597 / BCRC 20456 / CBS 421 / NBRC 0211 / NRRL Y-12639) TaxID=1071378 RepID=G0WG27_NAUDC|nr:hypothetical protein NDAI_0I01690 [Naumovozyma dairenensis CBS 421]CCD26738.1 hypothetical protein NDAI_0I01690 [Naumovozyma dairenensis CBS 421]